MIDILLRWFDRNAVRLIPRSTSGREVAFTDGYSLLELERAGITERQAASAGLPIDAARTSAVGANVVQLRKLRRIKGWT